MTRDHNDAIGIFDLSVFTSGCETLTGSDGANCVGCGIWGMNSGGA